MMRESMWFLINLACFTVQSEQPVLSETEVPSGTYEIGPYWNPETERNFLRKVTLSYSYRHTLYMVTNIDRFINS